MEMVNTRRIKRDILVNNLSQNQIHVIDSLDGEVVRETEKAVRIEWSTKCGRVAMWCPKSCIITDEMIRTQIEKDSYKAAHKFDKYTELLNRAKDLGVKGLRNKMKMETIYTKAEEQGIRL